ncbi:hemin uptake protein HemP [Microbaculum marinisediminis]|uniref:Hemin uptake protein HemP n=1 Tax=Microbaculum marinisediminis TaxID=2931392 RepID=A0AAW5R3Z1_9HYPH|nr:hemin uptake protein HemP [Microbaculum sp. A6E488]MCT8973583.1 hemin uptake protein HemP [Microbaculum sp. A6E488]
MHTGRRSPSPTAAPADTASQPEDSVESSDLFKGRRELIIRHNQERYVLRITRQGKLILNK